MRLITIVINYYAGVLMALLGYPGAASTTKK